MGFGILGTNFARLLLSRGKQLIQDYGLRPQVVALVDSSGALINEKGIDLARALGAQEKHKSLSVIADQWHTKMKTTDVIESLNSDVVIEVTPTNIIDGEPALTHIETALRCGRSVVTANKGPIAIALHSLLELARYNGVELRFSGTVGGGTPILNLGKTCFNGNPIRSISGILNGTTNFILSKMTEDGIPYTEALKEAQQLGYAEANPKHDVEGTDTAVKLVIIGNWILGMNLDIEDVRKKGITEVSHRDIENARKRGHVIKLIGTVDSAGARVAPQSLPIDDPLNVSGVMNAVTFDTEYSGKITIIGPGAGGTETATALLRDLIDIRRTLER